MGLVRTALELSLQGYTSLKASTTWESSNELVVLSCLSAKDLRSACVALTSQAEKKDQVLDRSLGLGYLRVSSGGRVWRTCRSRLKFHGSGLIL